MIRGDILRWQRRRMDTIITIKKFTPDYLGDGIIGEQWETLVSSSCTAYLWNSLAAAEDGHELVVTQTMKSLVRQGHTVVRSRMFKENVWAPLSTT